MSFAGSFDGWTLAFKTNELEALYQGSLAGPASIKYQKIVSSMLLVIGTVWNFILIYSIVVFLPLLETSHPVLHGAFYYGGMASIVAMISAATWSVLCGFVRSLQPYRMHSMFLWGLVVGGLRGIMGPDLPALPATYAICGIALTILNLDWRRAALVGELVWISHAACLLAFDSPLAVAQGMTFGFELKLWTVLVVPLWLLGVPVIAYLIERQQRRAFYQFADLAAEMLGNFEILGEMVPRFVAKELQQDKRRDVIADEYSEITMVFLYVDTAALEEHDDTHHANAFGSSINKIFSALDDVTSSYSTGILDKVENQTDTYVAAAGLQARRLQRLQYTHAYVACDFALRAKKALDALAITFGEQSPPRVRFRMGIHTGPAVAGVIGEQALSYSFFGDVVNTSSRMATNCQWGEIQLSQVAYNALSDLERKRLGIYCRGLVPIKGKGDMTLYLLQGMSLLRINSGASILASARSVGSAVSGAQSHRNQSHGSGHGVGGLMKKTHQKQQQKQKHQQTHQQQHHMNIDSTASLQLASNATHATDRGSTAQLAADDGKDTADSLAIEGGKRMSLEKFLRMSFRRGDAILAKEKLHPVWGRFLSQGREAEFQAFVQASNRSTLILLVALTAALTMFYVLRTAMATHYATAGEQAAVAGSLGVGLVPLAVLTGLNLRAPLWYRRHYHNANWVLLLAYGTVAVATPNMAFEVDVGRSWALNIAVGMTMTVSACTSVLGYNLVAIYMFFDGIAVPLGTVVGRPFHPTFYISYPERASFEFMQQAVVTGVFVLAIHYLLFPLALTNIRNDRKRYLLLSEVDVQRAHAESVLSVMIPVHVVDRLKMKTATSTQPSGATTPAAASSVVDGHIVDEYKLVTVVASDLVGFTAFAAEHKPDEVIALLNKLYSAFDRAVTDHNLYKIGTIGDAYIVSTGLNDRRSAGEQLLDALAFACEMQHIQDRVVRKQHPGAGIRMRIGVDTGPMQAGVLGSKLPTYKAWGAAVTGATLHESTCKPGRVHVSAATAELLGALPGGTSGFVLRADEVHRSEMQRKRPTDDEEMGAAMFLSRDDASGEHRSEDGSNTGMVLPNQPMPDAAGGKEDELDASKEDELVASKEDELVASKEEEDQRVERDEDEVGSMDGLLTPQPEDAV